MEERVYPPDRFGNTNPVVAENGMVAVKYRHNPPKPVKCPGMTYHFTISANILMTWAQFEHLPCLMAAKHSCCGGRSKAGVVVYASEDDVRRWTAGGGR